MKKILTTIALVSIFPFFTSGSVAADEYGKEQRKYYEEQERESRKFHDEQEREARKHREEMEREERKHYEEQDREARKHYEEQEREARKHHEEMEREGHAERGRHLSHRRHEYRYYPSSDVYYDEEKKVYFYLDGGKWGVSVKLPHGINLGGNDYVTIESDEDRPYDDHREHREKYGRHR